MKIDKDNIAALVGTIIIHVITLILLYFNVLRTSVPVDDVSIPIEFVDFIALTGPPSPSVASVPTPPTDVPPPPTDVQPPPTDVPPPTPTVQPEKKNQTPEKKNPTPEKKNPTPPKKNTTPPKKNPTPETKKSVPQPNEKLITQEKQKTETVPEGTKKDNPTVANETARKEKEEADRKQKEEADRIRKAEAESKRKEEEQQKQQAAIDSRADKAFGAGNAQDNTQNETLAQAPNQSNPFSNKNTGGDKTANGKVNLSGRSLAGDGQLPRPGYSVRAEGRVVVRIVVDPAGNVIQADIGPGTTTENATLRSSALDAAKRAKFNKINPSSNNQSGTITYNFNQI